MAGTHRPQKIVSGAQTGADRAALDAALALNLPYGGWVPKGRRAEDGPIPARYEHLVETETDDYAVRTKRNVRDSDATLIVYHDELTGGSALTARLAESLNRPLLTLDLRELSASEAAAALQNWLDRVQPVTLNVAGPRSSKDPEIYDAARDLLQRVLAT